MILNKNLTKKQYQLIWEEFRDNIRHATPIDKYETSDQKKARIAWLEANPEEWFKYYFPEESSAEPNAFHKAATRRVINNPEWYEIRYWSRELAKSTRSMMEDLFLMMVGHPPNACGSHTSDRTNSPKWRTGIDIDRQSIPQRRKKKYKILISSTCDAAELLLLPYKCHLEENARLKNDYGEQEKTGFWDTNRIVSKMGFAIKAFGYDQKPRGTKNKQNRPDIIEFDDFDTDVACLNSDRVDKAWEWANKAAIGTRSISIPTLIRWNGNIIAENCCIMRAAEFADHEETINITDDKGDSSWPEKNSDEDVKRILSKIPWSAQQTEYYNNPYTQGKAFKDIQWGKVPPLNKFPYLVAYGDPATSNKDREKGNGKSSFKALVLVGLLDGIYYVIKCRVDQMKNSDFVDCFYIMELWVAGKTQLFSYIENNSLQDPFYEQVFIPLFFKKSKEFKKMISIIPDGDKKPDKYSRIEGTLEPINRLKCLVFNEKEQEDNDMKRLVSQLKSVSPLSKTMDGPDALQGAVKKTNDRISYQGGLYVFARPKNKKRF